MSRTLKLKGQKFKHL